MKIQIGTFLAFGDEFFVVTSTEPPRVRSVAEPERPVFSPNLEAMRVIADQIVDVEPAPLSYAPIAGLEVQG